MCKQPARQFKFPTHPPWGGDRPVARRPDSRPQSCVSSHQICINPIIPPSLSVVVLEKRNDTGLSQRMQVSESHRRRRWPSGVKPQGAPKVINPMSCAGLRCSPWQGIAWAHGPPCWLLPGGVCWPWTFLETFSPAYPGEQQAGQSTFPILYTYWLASTEYNRDQHQGYRSYTFFCIIYLDSCLCRSSRVFASDSQCQSRNSARFNSSILRHRENMRGGKWSSVE